MPLNCMISPIHYNNLTNNTLQIIDFSERSFAIVIYCRFVRCEMTHVVVAFSNAWLTICYTILLDIIRRLVIICTLITE